ncbi:MULTISPECIES: carboxymuconolactone decarboxylase family protein [unclassified Pseudomonas]|uniref:carboxymuconolactone decarboxylase family protein n=1 Tax=unclassified Pseudomonas TaxID=196821 RepID=UPI001295ADDD|nr:MULTISPECIES: carboxymuconolactone decarboxylase family protein [unclassified Pseudomonas]MDU7558424.1 carboxymuconolactone decarboxylase family protein [Pseudomonas sp.]MQT44586.1 carboxymuconolactone decarboxylase family protein [Pseudomonas sp. FSL R10-0765]MQT52977.1 carboxymuconolactone decarboxylase family protein [Pseudomonas sp. FSL R10-2398]MQT99748.1 carboxymuconolactone decarboxylase family protein [Pseudomonas sp. FSL R10-2245]MQU10945.1 carboxymuconolactone decarboxylase family
MSNKRINYYEAAPNAMKAMMGMEKAASQSILPASLRELVRIRASQINGCAYCIDMHTADALKAGETPRRLMAISAWKETPFFDARERAALLWTETLTLVAERHAPDDIYQAVATHFNEQELSELTFVIAAINAWNRFGVGFAMQPQ